MDLTIKKILRLFKENVEKDSKNRLYISLYSVLKKAILASELANGTYLPASRKLSESLGISRSTVLKAYELLTFEGFIEAKVGSGHLIKIFETPEVSHNENSKIKFQYPSISEKGESFLKNIGLLNSTSDASIAFRPGVPPLDVFPVNQWKNLTNLYWRNIRASALSYSESSGNEQLKKSIANYLNLSRNIQCKNNQIIIVSGSLQSLYLIGNILINPGDEVAMENPTFPNVISIFKSLGAKLLGIEVDKQGINTELLKNQSPKLLHVTPSSHYPTSVKMSLKRRHELLDWANNNKAFIIENDYEHEVNNAENPLPSLFSLDKQQRTIYLSTFNRLLHPSIRLGYMVVPPYLLDAVNALLNHSHRFVPTSVQMVFKQFMEQKKLYAHVKNVIEVSLKRKEAFIKSIQENFGDEFIIHSSEANSLHMLLELKKGQKDVELVNRFAKHNILTHAYSKCFIDENKKQGLIFGYSSVRTPVIKSRIVLMKDVYSKRLK